MKAIEYLREENYKDLSSEQRRFVAIQLIKDVSDYAMVHNVSPDEAYEVCLRDSIWSDVEFAQHDIIVKGNVNSMCNLSQVVYEEGMEKGRLEGLKKGLEKGEKAIIKLITSGRMIVEEGAEAFDISVEEMQEKVRKYGLQAKAVEL